MNLPRSNFFGNCSVLQEVGDLTNLSRRYLFVVLQQMLRKRAYLRRVGLANALPSCAGSRAERIPQQANLGFGGLVVLRTSRGAEWVHEDGMPLKAHVSGRRFSRDHACC